jgi:DeoR/GlpR family transcriptional regulator of sugar metabolism
MLASERHQKILRFLEERGTARTVDLADEFDVTDETIRRDLQILAENHLISRVHGGASSLLGPTELQSFTERSTIRVDQKKAIASAAIQEIEQGMTYAFDSSTTAFEMVCSLPDLDYRVVTNAYAVLHHLARMERVELISTGGRYHPKTQTFNGGDSFGTLYRHNINTAFISCVGLDTRRGASEGFEAQAGFKETLVKMAEKVVLLVDSSKLGERSEYFFSRLQDISNIITDNDASPSCVAELRSLGCKVTIAECAEQSARAHAGH